VRWLLLVLVACTPGPDYHRPRAPTPPAFKEWKLAAPADAIPRGQWWTMFREPELDALEARLNVTNQNILLAIDNYVAASAQVRGARAAFWPTVSVAPSVTTSRGGVGRGGAFTNPGTTAVGTGTTIPTSSGNRFTIYSLPVEATWAPDLFGRVRRTVRQRQFAAQQAAADLENTRLLQQSALAQTYFELRGQDAQIELLEATVKADRAVVELTRSSYQLGIAAEADVLQAQVTLQDAIVQLTQAGIARAQFEHAIATLLGVPASSFALPRRPLVARPPAIPSVTPSQLLERRPDIAAAERAMASANEAIGLAYAAYYPVLDLTADAGFTSQTLSKLLSWPSRFWSLGASLAETLFDGGLRRANVDQAIAQWDAAIAAYRQTVLTAFQQVEDELAALRILADAVAQQRTGVEMAQRSFEVERARYANGLDPYVTLMTQQLVLLTAQQNLIVLEMQQMTASVLLIQALGGGWSTADLPSPGAASNAHLPK
jgi:NodT family efflux transporter outer membrane factor (OMF) lipoprotein